MKKCPSCAGIIEMRAKKCRFCGSDLPRPSDPKGLKAKDHPSYGTYTLISVLLPIIGVFLGIVEMKKPDVLDRKLGVYVLALSLTLLVVFALAFSSFMVIFFR